MGAQSLTTLDPALKIKYLEGLKSAVNNANPVATFFINTNGEDGNVPRIRKVPTIDGKGKQLQWPVHVRRSYGSGFRAELEAMPPSGQQGLATATQTLRWAYHTIKLSGQSMELSEGNENAYIDALELEMEQGEMDFRNLLARALYGTLVNGRTGVLATTAANTGVLVIALDANTLRSDMRGFFVGQYIDITDNTGTLITAGRARKITAVSIANKTITIDTNAVTDVANAGSGTVTTAAGNVVSVHGSSNDEYNGLRTLVSATGTVHGIDPTTEPAWVSATAGSTTTVISEDVLEEGYDAISTGPFGGEPDEDMVYLTAKEQRRTLASRLQAMKRWDGRELTLRAGWRGLDMSHGVMIADRYAPEDRVFILDREQLFWAQAYFGWDRPGGLEFWPALDDTDAVQARFKAYVTPGLRLRSSHAVVTVQQA